MGVRRSDVGGTLESLNSSYESRPHRVPKIDTRILCDTRIAFQVYTCGKIPYGRAGNAEVVEYVQRGQRLERPRVCPRNVYSIMKACWEK